MFYGTFVVGLSGQSHMNLWRLHSTLVDSHEILSRLGLRIAFTSSSSTTNPSDSHDLRIVYHAHVLTPTVSRVMCHIAFIPLLLQVSSQGCGGREDLLPAGGRSGLDLGGWCESGGGY